MKKITLHIFVLSLILVLFNCQKDDDTIIQEEQQKSSNVTFTTIRSKTIENNKALKTILEKQKTKQIEAKTSKTIYNEQYDFTINTDYAKVIEHNSLKRYTFGVTRTEDNGLLENLLLKEQTDGTYKVYLVQYAITIEERSTLANQEIVDVDNKITYVPLEDISSSIFNKVNSDAETCTVYSYEWQQASTCGAGGNHTYQDGGYSATNPGGCHAWGNPDLMATSGGYVLTSNEQDCGSGSTSGYDPSNNNTNSNTTNSNGGGNYTPIPDTEVILCTDCPLIEDDCSATDALNNLETTLGLDAALVTCLSDEDKCKQVSDLNEFVNQNSDNTEFAQIAAQAICDGYNVNFQEKIINKLTGKAKCVYDKISQQNSVRNILNKFQNQQSPAKLILKLNNTLGAFYAETHQPNENDLITININNENTVYGVDYQPNVLLAQTIFHEILHAEFFRELVEAIGAGNYSGASLEEIYQALIDNNLYTIYDHFRNYEDWSHNFMANYFIDTIARATQEYATGIAVADNEQPDNLYMNLAWRGLRYENYVAAWDMLTEEEKNSIDNTINNYIEENNNQICTE